MFAYCVSHIHRHWVQIKDKFPLDVTPLSRYGGTQLHIRHTKRFRGSIKPPPHLSGDKEVTPEDSREDRICMAHWSCVTSCIRLKVLLISNITESESIPRALKSCKLVKSLTRLNFFSPIC